MRLEISGRFACSSREDPAALHPVERRANTATHLRKLYQDGIRSDSETDGVTTREEKETLPMAYRGSVLNAIPGERPRHRQ